MRKRGERRKEGVRNDGADDCMFSCDGSSHFYDTSLFFGHSCFENFTDSTTLITLLEGAVRLVIFFGYILLISRMKDIQRVFMYHGAEHKCINCIEHGMELMWKMC